MKAVTINGVDEVTPRTAAVSLTELPRPEPEEGQIILEVRACGVCHTELDEIEGRTPPPRYPVVPGHEVVGTVVGRGRGADRYEIGSRVGAGWFYSSCGECGFCRSGRENLCPGFVATGRDVNGGYAEFMAVPESSAFPVPDPIPDESAAPLLCAGAVGYRALNLAGLPPGGTLGLSGFGASGRIVLQLLRRTKPDVDVFVFARNDGQRRTAREWGAAWTGTFAEDAPRKLDAVIDTTPVWKPVLKSLESIKAGGTVVINAIRKEAGDSSALATLRYEEHLWMEKRLTTVANVAPSDIRDFLSLAGDCGLAVDVDTYRLHDARRALFELRRGGSPRPKVITFA